MKFFSLETKKHLVGWSLVLGVLFSIFIHRYSTRIYGCISPTVDTSNPLAELSACRMVGWPWVIRSEIDPQKYIWSKFFLNSFFWIFVVLIILSLIRYFRKKNKAA